VDCAPIEGLQVLQCLLMFMPRAHQTFCPLPVVKSLEIMFRNRCWPTTFHTITIGDADEWCLNWPVSSAPRSYHRSGGNNVLLACDLSFVECGI
jgi:hypothetical protein